MKRLAAVGLVLMAQALPAQATEWTICAAADGKASFSVLSGSLGIGLATDFSVNVGEENWSTREGEGTPITRGQAFEDDRFIMIDVVTEDLASTIALLRVVKTTNDDGIQVYGGTLKVPGRGAWVVTCNGGEGE